MTAPVGDLTAREASIRIARDMSRMYGQAESLLVSSIARIVRKHGDPASFVEQAQMMAEMRRAAKTVVDILSNAAPTYAQRIVQAAADDGRLVAADQLLRLGGMTPERFATIDRVLPGVQSVHVIAEDLIYRLLSTHPRIMRFADDAYRAATAYSASLQVLGLQTGPQVQRAGWDRLMSQGVTGFIDRGGRHWNLATYVEMATRTASIRAWSDANQTRMAEAGITLYQIVVGNDACAKCARWAGSIVAATGPAGPQWRLMEHATHDFEYVQVHIDGTVDEAKQQGWRHPNCGCTLIAYFPGLPNPIVVNKTTYDPAREKAREALRGMERDIRRAKLEKAGALTDLDRHRAVKKIRGRQADIRAHIETTGLNRQRPREQLDYGFHLRSDSA